MSSNVNETLLERASEMREYWTGTLVEDAIDKAIKDNDLERLQYIVTQAEAEISIEEYYAADTY